MKDYYNKRIIKDAITLAINTNAYPEYDKRQLNEMLGLYYGGWYVGNDDNTDIVQFMTDRYGFGKLYKFDGKINKKVTMYLTTMMMRI